MTARSLVIYGKTGRPGADPPRLLEIYALRLGWYANSVSLLHDTLSLGDLFDGRLHELLIILGLVTHDDVELTWNTPRVVYGG